MTADDSIKCRCANCGMTGQVGSFQNPGVCLQAFPSFLPHPLPALVLTPFFARSLTLVRRSLLLNRTETLPTQVTPEFSVLLRHTDEPQRGRNSCLWLQSRSVLSSFGVVLMSCRVNFHVVQSALQYSPCRI